MKFYPATARTVFDRSPPPAIADPASAGRFLDLIRFKTTVEPFGSRPATNSFTRPPMPCPNASAPPVLRHHNRFEQVMPSTDAPGRMNAEISSLPHPAAPGPADQLESIASPRRISMGLLANFRRLFDSNFARGLNLRQACAARFRPQSAAPVGRMRAG